MKSKYLVNQVLQSCNSKQFLAKINKKEKSIEVENQSMVVKSLPKQTKSFSVNHSITVAIDNTSQLISFLTNAKINPQKESSIIVSLKAYLIQLKQHLKTNLLVLKPNNLNKNHFSHLKLNVNLKNNETFQIKNLNSEKYPNKILNTLQNCSGIFNENNRIKKQIQKKPYIKKGTLPQINQKLTNQMDNKQIYVVENRNSLNNDEINNKERIKNKEKEQITKNISVRPQIQKRKLIRVKTQIQKDSKSILGEQKVKKVDPLKIIQRLKQKIKSHELLIEKLKNKVTQFQNTCLKNNHHKIDTNQQKTDQIQSIQQQTSKQKSQTNKTKQQTNIENINFQKTFDNEQMSQVEVLKAQLKSRQYEIVSLLSLIQTHNL